MTFVRRNFAFSCTGVTSTGVSVVLILHALLRLVRGVLGVVLDELFVESVPITLNSTSGSLSTMS